MPTEPPLDRATLLAALDRVIDPRTGKGLAEAGLVRGLILAPGRAGFMLEVPAAEVPHYQPVRDEAERLIAGLPGVQRAQVVLTAETAGGPAEPPQAPGVTRVRKGARLANDPAAQPAPPADAERPAHVKKVIAVASGKGGVGKSTRACGSGCSTPTSMARRRRGCWGWTGSRCSPTASCSRFRPGA